MSQCGSIFLCTVLNGLFVGSSSSQSHTSFCSVFILLLFFVFSTLAPGSVLHLKVQAQPEYQSPRKKPEYQSPRKKVCGEGAGENHERLKKLPSLPGKHIIEQEETKFLSPQRCQRKSFRRRCLYVLGIIPARTVESQQFSSLLRWGVVPFLTSRYEIFTGVEVSN